MSATDLLEEIVKTYITSLVMSKAVKALGEKDCAEIIQGTGYIIVGVDTILLLKKPIQTIIESWNKIKSVGDSIENSKFIEIITIIFKKYKEVVGE